MFELLIEREFCAAHAIRIGGVMEPLHGHNWRVQIVITGESLDEDGLLCDFHALERAIDAVLDRWNNRNLNELESFNPTAERLARTIGERLLPHLPGLAAVPLRLARVQISEAPGCHALWHP